MPLYANVAPPPRRAPDNGLLVVAQRLGLLEGMLAASDGDAPTVPPDMPSGVVPDNATGGNVRQWHEVGGVNFLPEPCLGGGTYDPCDPDAAPLVDASAYPAGVEVAGFPIKVGVSCSAVDPYTRDESRRAAVSTLNVFQHRIAADEFWNGTQAQESSWPNPYLADAATPIVGSDLSTCGALARLEEAVAGNAVGSGPTFYCGGAQGLIHASPALATAWSKDYLVHREGGLLVTALGTVVVSGPGYNGVGPNGVTPAVGSSYAYASGMVSVRLSDTQLFDRATSIDKAGNVYEQWAERAANIALDNCCVVAVEVDMTECGAAV